MAIECSLCDYNNDFYTSERNSKAFEVNVRPAYSMRACGRGYAGFRQGKYCSNLATRVIPFLVVSKSSVGETTSKTALPHFSKDRVA